MAILAIEHLETHNRHFRLAIDISIWQFQIQSGQGGQNPALRTLYYRLLKLLGLGIQPLFVFDGPDKPKIKRNKTGGAFTAYLDNFLSKKLLDRFGFPYHDAPGEAEAECALLQKEGLVDAVLSEDVDTMMFGCTKSLRSWTAESDRNSKTPTHVSMYTAEATIKNSGMDRNGMILVALMSGGDYDTEGLSHCGPKTACEAARAGFGRELYRLAKDDRVGWSTWRERLQHELCTNESKFFKQKHKTVRIPDTFPCQEVLNYYKQPAVSSPGRVTLLRASIRWHTKIDIPELRAFVAEAFNWTYRGGAKHLIKGFAPVLLTHKLMNFGVQDQDNIRSDDFEARAREESQYVIAIHARRHHWNTDGCPELRISYTPNNIVGLNMDAEEEPTQPDDIAEESELDRAESDRDETSHSASPTKRKARSTYDPSQPEKIWVLETIIKLGVPLLAETWEEDLRSPKKFASRKARGRAAQAKAMKGTSQGAMDKYVKITKPVHQREQVCSATAPEAPCDTRSSDDLTSGIPMSTQKPPKSPRGLGQKKGNPALPLKHTKIVNPWTLAKRPSDTYACKSPTRYSALGIYAPNDAERREPRPRPPNDCVRRDDMVNNLVKVPETPSNGLNKKHSRTKSPGSDSNDMQGYRPLDNVTVRTLRQRRITTSRRPDGPSPMVDDAATGLITPLATQKREGISLIPKTPTLKSKHEVIDLLLMDEEEEIQIILDEMKVARHISYGSSPRCEPEMSPASDNSALPSPTLLFPPTLSTTVDAKLSHKISSTVILDGPGLSSKNGTNKKSIIVRESLEGAWKHLETWEGTAGKKSFSDVEVLDMTGIEEI